MDIDGIYEKYKNQIKTMYKWKNAKTVKDFFENIFDKISFEEKKIIIDIISRI